MSTAMETGSSAEVINFFGTLNHRIRTKIIQLLFEHTELSYTELLQTLDIPAGKLNFHLRKIKDLIVLDNGKYRLSHLGITAHKFLREIQSEYGYGIEKREANILIIDDDKGMCETLTDILQETGYKTDAAHTGEEALKKAKEKFYNLALIDIKLSDMTGTEVIGRLKELHPNTIAIIITAFASLQNAIESLNKGAYAYFMKPLNMDEVLTTIGKALEKQRPFVEDLGLLFKRASLRSRIFATLIDVVFIVVCTGAIFFLSPHLTFLFILLVAWLMFTVLEGYKGETLGKYLLGLRVVKTDGRKLSFADAAVRNIGKVFLLPIDLLLGLRYHKLGHIRFFGHYTNSTVVTTKGVSRQVNY